MFGVVSRKMPRLNRSQQKKKQLIALLTLFPCLFPSTSNAFPWCGKKILNKAFSPKFGRGYGAPGHKRNSFKRQKAKPVWESFVESGNDRLFQSHTRMYIDEFNALLDDVKDLKLLLAKVATKLRFSNKILLLFFWIVKYHDYATLAWIFGSSRPVIVQLIDLALPLLVGHFVKFIPNRIESDKTSSLSSNIVAVIDSTIHARRKNAKDQHVHWNEHYHCHGMLTHLLVDFDGFIASFVTSVAAKMHDSNASRYFKPFVRLLDGRYAIGDPGYNGVPYVVSGLKFNQLNSDEKREFDRVSRSEQVIIEHVNSFIKSCKVLSKKNQFIHGRDKHISCVFIVCGWYNWMKRNFNKFDSVA